MRFFYDTEFIEDGATIELVSIGIVAEDGREYYAVSTDADHSRANAWVKENVGTPICIALRQTPGIKKRHSRVPFSDAANALSSRRFLFVEDKRIFFVSYVNERL